MGSAKRVGGQRRLTGGPWPILAVLVLAFALRTINLNGRPLWYDEAFAVLYAEKPFETMLYGTVAQVEGAAADVHPLFFYSLLHLWMKLVGQSPLAVRSLSVLLGAATVGMVYLLARRIFDRKVGLLAALVASLAPFAVYYAQEARMYALLGFVAMTTAYFFTRAWSGGRKGDWLLFGLFGAMTLYAHNLGFAFLAGLDLWVLGTWLRSGWREPLWRKRNFGSLLLAHLLMLALFAPWLAIVPSQFGKIRHAYWVERPGLTTLIQTLLVFHFGYDNQALPPWLLPPALFFSLLIPAIVVVALLRGRAARRRPAFHALPLLLAVAPPLLIFVLSQVQPVYIIRALLPSALAYYVLLVAVLTRRTIPSFVRWGIWLPALGIVVASLVNHYGYAHFPRPPFAEAAAYLRAHYQPGDVIVHSNKLTFLPTHYYDRTLPQAFIADKPGSPSDTLAYPTQQALGLFATQDLPTATEGHDRVWFVIFQRAVEEYQEAGYATHPHLAWLEGHYQREGVTSFNDLDVYEYRAIPEGDREP